MNIYNRHNNSAFENLFNLLIRLKVVDKTHLYPRWIDTYNFAFRMEAHKIMEEHQNG